MYLLKVIPIATKLPEKYFSYFSNTKIKIGSLVEIKIRNRKISGIVSELKDVKNEKINLKGEKFSLKKIEKLLKEDFIDEKIIKALMESSFLFGVTESVIIEIFLNDYLLEIVKNISLNTKVQSKEEKVGKNEAVLGNKKERFELYIRELEKEIKKENSCVIFSPTTNDLKSLQNSIESKFNENIIIFHGEQNKKERDFNLDKLNEEIPKIILSTPSIFPFLIEKNINLNLVIIDKENSFSYYSHKIKKEIDSREIIKNITLSLKLKMLIGGEILSLNTFKDIKNKKIKLTDFKDKSETKKILILDLIKEKSEQKIKTKYSSVYFKQEVISKLEDYKNKGEGKIFLYTKRKGIAGETICKDCNHVLKCKTCEKPYILFKENINKKREYLCAICKNKKEISKEENLSCENCGSWRMEGIGIGSEGIENNLKENGFKVFLIDSKNTNTKTKIKKILEEWQNEKLSILVGTDLALNNINENHKIDFAGIISIDTLFSIPEINMDEKILNLIIEFKEKCKTKNKLFIETRLKDAELWKYIEENDYLSFLEKELQNRENLNLPPFSNIISFRLKIKDIKYKNRIENLFSEILKEEELKEENIIWKKDSKNGEYLGFIIINKKILESVDKEGNIIATNLAKKIATLFSDFNLEINPSSLHI
ncbi:MAG: hypothetical protein KBD12_00650 [Candidatus Pacebacteria bacterium]|nr:hypothetical protein [Candidatus Paceibacterota bacterium]